MVRVLITILEGVGIAAVITLAVGAYLLLAILMDWIP